jgi:hypothetical protein
MFSCQLLGHKSQYSTNMRSCFLKLLLVTQSETAGSQPLGKRCSKASFSVLSQIYAKMWKAIFTKFFFILETKRLFHNLFFKRSSKACIYGNKSNQVKNEKLFCLSLLLDAGQLFQNLFWLHKVLFKECCHFFKWNDVCLVV